MAVTGATAKYKLPYFKPSDSPPDMAAGTQAISDRVEELLAKGGNVSIAADGTITIGFKKVTEAMLADDSVTAPKIAGDAVGSSELADGAVTSGKLKPTQGLIQSNKNLILASTYKDIPGAVLEITPAVASYLRCTCVFTFGHEGASGSAEGSLSLDGEAQTITANYFGPSGSQASVSTVIDLSLPEAGHKYTVKMIAQKTTGSPFAVAGLTRTAYQLVAA